MSHLTHLALSLLIGRFVEPNGLFRALVAIAHTRQVLGNVWRSAWVVKKNYVLAQSGPREEGERAL